MKTNFLSKWQLELLREALAMLAHEEQQSRPPVQVKGSRRRRKAARVDHKVEVEAFFAM